MKASFAALLITLPAVAAEQRAAHERLAVDTHLHLTMSVAARPFFKGEPGEFVTYSARHQLSNQVDADQLIRAKTQLVIGTLWPPFRIRPGRTSLDEALHQLEELKEFCRRRPEFAVVTTPAQARRVIARGRIAVVPGIEGGEGIDSADDVDRLYAAGARSVTLVHFGDTHLGGAALGQTAFNLFGRVSDAVNPKGLSELGTEVVKRMLELGMVVDLAHASDATSRDVLALAEAKGLPVINSHSGARALLPIERNVSDELAARIGKGGGMVGVTVFDKQVSGVPDSEKWEGYVPGSCDDVVAHWKHFATVMPPVQVNLGSDMNGMILRPGAGGSCPNGIRNTGDLPDLYDALKERGVPAEAVDGMGWQFLQLWETLEKKADPEAREQAREANGRPASAFDVAM